jgi:hypothetical protein
MVSVCCSAKPWLDNWHEDGNIMYGICDNCREHCEFQEDDDE